MALYTWSTLLFGTSLVCSIPICSPNGQDTLIYNKCLQQFFTLTKYSGCWEIMVLYFDKLNISQKGLIILLSMWSAEDQRAQPPQTCSLRNQQLQVFCAKHPNLLRISISSSNFLFPSLTNNPLQIRVKLIECGVFVSITVNYNSTEWKWTLKYSLMARGDICIEIWQILWMARWSIVIAGLARQTAQCQPRSNHKRGPTTKFLRPRQPHHIKTRHL